MIAVDNFCTIGNRNEYSTKQALNSDISTLPSLYSTW